MDQGSLLPFTRQAISAGVYESEIEGLLWDNLEELTGDNLFRVARQPVLSSGGRPDILALDSAGRVVVIEVKRDVDRHQLAQVAAAVNVPCELRWERPRKGTSHTATLLEPGRILLPDGSEHRSPSGAAMAAADVASYDGWYAWRLPDGRTLNDARHEVATRSL